MATQLPTSVFLLDLVQRWCPWRSRTAGNPSFVHGRKLCLGNSKLGRIQMTGVGKKIGCPGLVKMWWRILWRGRAAVIPSNWRTLVNSCRRSYTHWGVARKTAWRVDSVKDGGGRDELKLTTEPFVGKLETLMLRSWCWRKSAPRIGKETGASWNNQEPKRKGIILEPKQNNKEPSAVSRRTLEDAKEAGAGNTEALVSIRNWQPNNSS